MNVRWQLLILLIPAASFAGEYAVLTSGFRVHADRHEQTGEVVILYAESGKVEFPATLIASFEQEEAVPAPKVVAEEPKAPATLLKLDTRQLVSAAARYAGLPEALVHSVARAESAYHTDAVSKKGAMGVMQLMPATANHWNADPKDPAQNIYAGALYLRELLIKYDGQVSKALAAYNAGPGAVEKYHGVPPYPETRNYVNRVIADYVRSSQSSSQ
jgi:soluble lytic murein transglycosylase-like protein